MCRQAGRPIQVMVVQETRWSLNSEWTTGHHHIIHSSSGTRKDGLMVMIEKTFVLSSQAIRSSAIIPGRVLQLRLDLEPCLHIFAIYQHVWHDSSADPDCMKNREKVWTSLQVGLRGVPWRSQLVIAEYPLLLEPPHAGQGLAPV